MLKAGKSMRYAMPQLKAMEESRKIFELPEVEYLYTDDAHLQGNTYLGVFPSLNNKVSPIAPIGFEGMPQVEWPEDVELRIVEEDADFERAVLDLETSTGPEKWLGLDTEHVSADFDAGRHHRGSTCTIQVSSQSLTVIFRVSTSPKSRMAAVLRKLEGARF